MRVFVLARGVKTTPGLYTSYCWPPTYNISQCDRLLDVWKLRNAGFKGIKVNVHLLNSARFVGMPRHVRKLDYRCPRCLKDQRDRDGLEKHLMRGHQCLIGCQCEPLECVHCHIMVKNKQNWEKHLRSDRHRAAIGIKFTEHEDLTDYIKSDSSFLWRHEIETVLDILGDLNDLKGTVYRMFEKFHITDNKNIALLNEYSTTVLVVRQRAWAMEDSSFILQALSTCAQMVKSFFVMRKSIRTRFLGDRQHTLARLNTYLDNLREELVRTELSAETLELINIVRKRLVQETLKKV